MALTKSQQLIVDAVPTNWLDPLLTGPDRVGNVPFGCPEIEKLLRAVRERVILAVTPPPRKRAATKARDAKRAASTVGAKRKKP